MKRIDNHPFLALIALFLFGVSLLSGRAQLPGEEGLWTAESRSSPAEAVSTNETRTTDQQQRRRGFGRFGGNIEGMYKAQITPHWFANNTRFWYRNDLGGGSKEFIL